MKLFRPVWFLLLISSLVLGQSTSGNNAKSDDNRIADQIKTLQDAIASQQQQIEALKQELASRKVEPEPRLSNASLTTAMPATAVAQETEKPKESPLSFRIGGAD